MAVPRLRTSASGSFSGELPVTSTEVHLTTPNAVAGLDLRRLTEPRCVAPPMAVDSRGADVMALENMADVGGVLLTASHGLDDAPSAFIPGRRGHGKPIIRVVDDA